MQYTLDKTLMAFKIITFELLAGVSVNYDQNTCDKLSTC